MLYGRSDIAEVTVSETGHRHARKKGQDGPFVLDCAECEAAPTILFGVGARENQKTWSTSREDAPLTEAEQREREAARDMLLAGQVTEYEEFRAWQRARRAGTA